MDLVPQAPEARHQHAAWVWEDTSSGRGGNNVNSNGSGGEAWMYIFGGSSVALSEARRK